ncbi:MAG: DUF4340 domain-containing protein [Planctomycetota bacterium]
MNELTKTLVFLLVAAASVMGAIWGKPGMVGVEVPDKVGQPLFTDFEDASSAESLKVVDFDEDTGEFSEFEVAKKNGVWVIPSHEDYEADATDSLKAVATMFMDLEVLGVAAEDKSIHSTFGVIEPNEDEVESGDEGIGKLIQLGDAKGNKLVNLIVGKQVKDQEGQRYVRIPKQDPTYVVSIDPDKLSTKFEDWIEQDVLKLNAMDITTMTINDYSVTPAITPSGRLSVEQEQRLAMKVDWNGDDFKWDLVRLEELAGGELSPTKLLDNEELDKSKLDEMKNSLSGLKIADIRRKPDGLIQALKSGESNEMWSDNQGVRSLVERGFFPVGGESGITMLSSDGEVGIGTKDGVEYQLRFGQIAGAPGESDSINRFLMVVASLDQSKFPPPALEEVPEEPAAAEGEEGEKTPNPERDRIMKENQRKLDEYNEKRNKALEKVNELNGRFAEWYYVVSEEVYKDIHLSRPDVIKEKPGSADEGFGVDSLRKLEDEGLKQDEKK